VAPKKKEKGLGGGGGAGGGGGWAWATPGNHDVQGEKIKSIKSAGTERGAHHIRPDTNLQDVGKRVKTQKNDAEGPASPLGFHGGVGRKFLLDETGKDDLIRTPGVDGISVEHRIAGAYGNRRNTKK